MQGGWVVAHVQSCVTTTTPDEGDVRGGGEDMQREGGRLSANRRRRRRRRRAFTSTHDEREKKQQREKKKKKSGCFPGWKTSIHPSARRSRPAWCVSCDGEPKRRLHPVLTSSSACDDGIGVVMMNRKGEGKAGDCQLTYKHTLHTYSETPPRLPQR